MAIVDWKESNREIPSDSEWSAFTSEQKDHYRLSWVMLYLRTMQSGYLFPRGNSHGTTYWAHAYEMDRRFAMER